MLNELTAVRSMPAVRRVEAAQLADGRRVMAATDNPALVVEGDYFEDAYLTLEEALENTRPGPLDQ